MDALVYEKKHEKKKKKKKKKLRTLKGLKLCQTANKRRLSTSALAARIAGFRVLDEDGLAKFTAISIHAWDGVVRDADRLCALGFGSGLFKIRK
jgi:excinuclease UvrABC ATPase subunit